MRLSVPLVVALFGVSVFAGDARGQACRHRWQPCAICSAAPVPVGGTPLSVSVRSVGVAKADTGEAYVPEKSVPPGNIMRAPVPLPPPVTVVKPATLPSVGLLPVPPSPKKEEPAAAAPCAELTALRTEVGAIRNDMAEMNREIRSLGEKVDTVIGLLPGKAVSFTGIDGADYLARQTPWGLEVNYWGVWKRAQQADGGVVGVFQGEGTGASFIPLVSLERLQKSLSDGK